MNENLIIVFTRNPELGKVKTRLAKIVGDEAALKIYKFLLNHTETTIRNINCDKAIYYSIKVRDNDIWNNNIYQKYVQNGEDLGLKMLNAFDNGFNKEYEKAVIVGSDLYDLKPEHIEDAFRQLDENDLVIGPAKDGGYYLLGMKTLHSEVFKNKSWGTSTVFENTINNLQNKRVFLLEELNDIDTYDDLKNIKELKELI
jgi:rSAM/selenodomain-associated transferase 1